MIPLRKAVQPGGAAFVVGNTRVFAPVELARQFDSPEGQKQYRAESALYVATPAVLRYLGIDPATVDPGTDFLADRSVRTDGLVIPSMTSGRRAHRHERPEDRRRAPPVRLGQRAQPPRFITLDGLRRHGWNQIPAGWLVESSRPLTSDQIADARRVAADAGLTIEVRERKAVLTKSMAIATAAGALLALAILAMTVGLIRSESAGDLRTLTATGATSGSAAR